MSIPLRVSQSFISMSDVIRTLAGAIRFRIREAPGTIAIPQAQFAPALPLGLPNVFRNPWMPVGTLSFQRTLATAIDIFTSGHSLKMGRIDAVPYAAQVIPHKSIRGFPYKKLMRSDLVKGAVTIPILGSRPKPTAVSFLDLAPEPNLRSDRLRGHGFSIDAYRKDIT